MESKTLSENTPQQEVLALFYAGNYTTVLRRLSQYNHPLINELFPTWRSDTSLGFNSPDISLTEDQIQVLRNFVVQKVAFNLIVAAALLLIGGAAIILGLISVVKLLGIDLNSSSYPQAYCIGVPLGIPIVVLGFSGFKDYRSPNRGLW